MTSITIKGFVDITVLNEDGTVKEHQYKENTLTHAALASMFCDFLFRGDSNDGGTAEADVLAYLERANGSIKHNAAPVRDQVLQGTNGVTPDAPIFSHRQPRNIGIYCLNTFIQKDESNRSAGQLKFDYRSQVAPYVMPNGAGLSPYVTFWNSGSSKDSFYPAYETDNPKFIRSTIDCSFNLPELCFTHSLQKSNGNAEVRSIVWGAGHAALTSSIDYFYSSVFDVRSRVLKKDKFNYGGYSPFYATEQRLIERNNMTTPHTILWQHASRPNGYGYESLPESHVYGFDMTVPGDNNLNEDGTDGSMGVEDVTVSSHSYMWSFMQGVIIGSNAFSLENESTSSSFNIKFNTSGNNVTVNVRKTANWKTTTTSTTLALTLALTFTTGGSDYAQYTDGTNNITKPVLAHNLATGNLEVFFTPSYHNTSKKFRVGRAIVNPSTFAKVGDIEYFESDFCISNYRLSMPGSSTDVTSSSYPRARAVSGFIDYNTGTTENREYYLPYIAYCDAPYYENGIGTHFVTPGTSVQDPGQYMRLGVQCMFKSGKIVPIRLYIQGHASSGRGYPTDTLSSQEQNMYSTRGVYGVYRYNLWAYAPPTSAGTSAPIQFIPLTGNSYQSGSLSYVSPSQVMCGLDLDQPVTKGTNEVLLLSYGWKISQVSSETS